MTFRQLSLPSSRLILLTALMLQNFAEIATVSANEPRQLQTTNALRWQKRLLFVNTESREARKLITAWQQEFEMALEERKLLILQLTSDKQWTTQNQKTYLNAGIANEICRDSLYLVGLDGGTKFRDSITAKSLNKLFDIIDAMPMRRAELN